MENFDENIENEYRKRFQDFEEMPDDFLWTSIQERIAPEKKRPAVVIWWNNARGPISIAASVLIGLFVGGYFLLKKDKVVDSPITHLSTKETKAIKKEEKPSNLAITKENELSGNLNKQRIANKNVIMIENNKADIVSSKTSIKIEEERNLAAEDMPTEPNLATVIQENKESQKNIDIKNEVINDKINISKSSDSNNLGIANNHEERPLDSLVDDIAAYMMDSDSTNQSLTLLHSKDVSLTDIKKELETPVLSLPDLAVEIKEDKKLVFIPPTEIFANVTSTLNYYRFSPNRGDDILVNDFSSSSQRLGFAAQLGFVYPIGKKMDLRTGFSYLTGKSTINYGVTDNGQKNITVVDNNSVQFESNKLFKTENRNWQYLELQSDVLYAIRPMHALSIGMKVGVQTAALRKPLFQTRLGYRVSKAVSDRWAVWLEPSLSISLSSQKSMENLFMYRTTGFGLNMGVSLLR